MRFLPLLFVFLCVINCVLLTTGFIRRQVDDDDTEANDLQQLIIRLDEGDRQVVYSVIQMPFMEKMHMCLTGESIPSYASANIRYMLKNLEESLSKDDKKILQWTIDRVKRKAAAFNCDSLKPFN